MLKKKFMLRTNLCDFRVPHGVVGAPGRQVVVRLHLDEVGHRVERLRFLRVSPGDFLKRVRGISNATNNISLWDTVVIDRTSKSPDTL